MSTPRTSERTAVVDQPREWLTFQQFCDYCQVSTRTGRSWIAQGRVPAYRVGPTQIRVRLADVEALFERIPTAGGAR